MNEEIIKESIYESCDICGIITKNQWEIWFCNKNPDGIINPKNHGNNDTCDDDYCQPDTIELDINDFRIIQSDIYEVHPRCIRCGYLRGY